MVTEGKGFFKRLVTACTDYSGYYGLLKNYRGTIKYFICYSLLLGALMGVVSGFTATINTSEYLWFFYNNVPSVTYTPGNLAINEETPIVASEGGLTVIFTDNIEDGVVDEYKNNNGVLIIFAQTEYTVMENGTQISNYKYSSFPEFSFTNDDVKGLSTKIPVLIIMFGVLTFAMKLFGIPLGLIVSILILSVIALIISHIVKIKMTYKDLFRTTVYAVSAPAFIYEAVITAVPAVKSLRLIYYAAGAIVLYCVISAVKKAARTAREKGTAVIETGRS